MMEDTTTYDIGPINTLVDLNKDFTNFSAELSITTEKENSPFKMAIVDQTIIDTGDIPFKDFAGMAGANVKWTKNIFKNHYIALQSDKDQKVKVFIDLKELPHHKVEEKGLEEPKPTPNPNSNLNPTVKPVRTKPAEPEIKEKFTMSEHTSMFSKTWFKIFIGSCVLIVIILLLKNKDKGSNESNNNNVGNVGMRPTKYRSRLNFNPHYE